MSGHVGDLNEKQAIALQKFKEAVSDLQCPEHDDFYLLRWLRARNFDLKKSELMFRNHIDWRKKVSADKILQDYTEPEVLKKFFTGGLHGFSKDGCPIWIDPFGNIDLKGLLRSAKKSDAVLSLDCFCEIVSMVEDNYPETLRIAFVINAPRIFPVIFRLVKPFLAEETAKKIHIFGSNYKEELYKYIDKDQLPSHWGGTCVDRDGDRKCRSKICPGGVVPKEYYRKYDLEAENLTSVDVGRGSSLQLDYTVRVPNCIIRWQFSTEGFDIGFGIYRRTKDSRQKAGEMEEIFPSQRVNSHLILEDGSIVCSKAGTYIIRFDNTYSWTRSKTIRYLIEVLEPEDGYSIPGSSSNKMISQSCQWTQDSELKK
ncbi:SEC14-like protein 2,SEC14-like protein 4,Putative SEC14-like protein 6,SEC14-like protein 3 [Mytilus coruscus]|uniref:SEC14-like protein 2,SEC14-like protein 4,Putative SEC14-like protein 6,SEC14-like protein 3 n=1 Tax=Mytilus coruscus TaxID=42192 RepID=A0A6J8E6Z9_MYTCO|nr:SEC14-like protein 2,SEC14-like protein 4,Putative SEC14-like protein 6,SEC14-like protein 3 [Mytilus coruscus]